MVAVSSRERSADASIWSHSFPPRSGRRRERTFNVTDVNLNGESHRAIEAEPPTRITWKVRIPDNAWLRVNVGTEARSLDG